MRILAATLTSLLFLASCATAPAPPPIRWTVAPDSGEYQTYLDGGTASISGQVFLRTVGGDVKVGAGSPVTLDPATAYSHEWWHQAGKWWLRRAITPPDPIFAQARHTTTADAEGRFHFEDLAAGSYYLRSQVTWDAGRYTYVDDTQGGLVWRQVALKDGEKVDVVLTWPNPELP